MKTRMRAVPIALIGFAALSGMLPEVAPAAPAVSNYPLVSSQRVTRTEFNYTYQVTFQNTGDAVRNVVAHVTSNSSATIIVDGGIAAGDISTDASATSATDTITFRQDRSVAFNPSNLNWRFDYTPAPVSQTAIIDENGGTFEGPGGAVLAVASAELYDPLNNSGSPAASMGTARYYHTETLLQDGKVLVVGGYDNYSAFSSCELYY